MSDAPVAAPAKTATTPPTTKPTDTVPQMVDGKPVVHIKVYSPFKTYFNGLGTSISAVNKTGPFDILPEHHNFITLLDACDVIVRTTKDQVKIRISRGIMHVKANEVIVFLDV